MQQATKSEEAFKWQSLLWHNKKIYLFNLLTPSCDKHISSPNDIHRLSTGFSVHENTQTDQVEVVILI